MGVLQMTLVFATRMDRTNKFEQIVREDVERFQRSLPFKPGTDLKMVLLHSHLLIEERLQEFIELLVANPSELGDARLTFLQRLALAKALHTRLDLFGYAWVWDSVRTLNGLRNKMAHKVAPEGFLDQIDKFNKSLESRLPRPLTGDRSDPEYRMASFGFLVSVLNMCLARMLRAELMAKGRVPDASGA